MEYIQVQPENIYCEDFQAHLIETGRDALIVVNSITEGKAEGSTNTRAHIASHDSILMEIDEDGQEYPSDYNGDYILTEHIEDALCIS